MIKPTISIATSVQYGNYKKFYDRALFMSNVCLNKIDEIKQYIKLPRNLYIHLRPIRNAYGKAFYFTKEKNSRSYKQYIVEVDVRQDNDVFYNTLLHELVHVEQFYTNRLKDIGLSTHFCWKGDIMKFQGLSHEEYINLPWEIEANNRAEILTPLIFC